MGSALECWLFLLLPTTHHSVFFLFFVFFFRPGPGCLKDGGRYPPHKSLSSGKRIMFCQHLPAGCMVVYPVHRVVHSLNNFAQKLYATLSGIRSGSVHNMTNSVKEELSCSLTNTFVLSCAFYS